MKNVMMILVATILFTQMGSKATDFQVDPGHAFSSFKVGHIGIGVTHGRFNDVSGRLNLEAGVVELKIKTASLDTAHAKRDQHLKSPDFLNVVQFPEMTFVATKVAAVSKQQYQLEGKLTIHGVSKNVSVTLNKTGEGKDPWGNYRLGMETSFKIKRADYGMNFMQEAVSDEIEIAVSIEAIRK